MKNKPCFTLQVREIFSGASNCAWKVTLRLGWKVWVSSGRTWGLVVLLATTCCAAVAANVVKWIVHHWLLTLFALALHCWLLSLRERTIRLDFSSHYCWAISLNLDSSDGPENVEIGANDYILGLPLLLRAGSFFDTVMKLRFSYLLDLAIIINRFA